MTLHHINPTKETLHGTFSRDLAPILTIDSGDTVRFRTLDANWYIEPRTSTRYEEAPATFSPLPVHHNGHALCGPIAIRGAMPGMTLAVRVDALRVGSWGYTAVGGWPHVVNQRLGLMNEGTYLLWELDADKLLGRNQHGHTVALQPFMGVMGMPPAQSGWHSTVPPRVTGGNLDCKALGVGSTLYLPIAVKGGLFSTGDGHARQGDGESCVMAIECPMESADLTLTLHPDLHITTPRAHTPHGWITFGLHPDLNEATMIALEAMVDLMQELYELTRHQAAGLASVVVDLHITQIVNGVRGVHAILPHSAIGGLTQIHLNG